MPWHPCVGTRDTITADEGYAVNFYESDDKIDDPAGGHSPYQVKSHCRVSDGQWVAWIGKGFGNELGDGTAVNDWAANIANASWAWVGYFPDDGSPPTVFDLPLEPCFTWATGRYSTTSHCAIRNLFGLTFAPNQKCEMTSWFSGAIDIQVRTDGVTVWVAVLAQESTMYPWLSTRRRTDGCGIDQQSIRQDASAEALILGGDGDPFAHDTTSEGHNHQLTWWQKSDVVGNDQDDAGVNSSFRWQPARLTVFAGGIGGFTKLDTIQAGYGNCYDYGLIGHLEAAASPAEPGVLHVLWAEGGFRRERDSVTLVTWDGMRGLAGQRLNYSRWDAISKLLDRDIGGSEDGSDIAGHRAGNFSGDWVWTDEYILRNDHGSPCAFIWSWATDAEPDITRTMGPTTLDPNLFAYFDLTSGAPVFVQLLDSGLLPTPAEVGFVPIPVGTLTTFGPPAIRPDNASSPTRSHFASSLYTDPTLADTDVYILGLNFSITGTPASQFSAFYRIPVDGSDTFTFLDGVRLMQFSIVDPGGNPHVACSDFVSDPGNIWIPAQGPSFAAGGGGVWHLVRTCERTWELLQGFPPSSLPDAGLDLAGAWANFPNPVVALNSPPSIVTDDVGHDWLAAGGIVPPGQDSGGFPFYAAALRARICRCCVPCIQRIGMHIWEQH